MSKFQKQNKVIDLYDFVSKNKPQQPPHPRPKKQPDGSSASFGLSTLMYFNNNGSLSSIRSHKLGSTFSKIETDRFADMVGQARREIQEMKLKRLELETEWKQKRADATAVKGNESMIGPRQSQLQQSLNSSEVQEYDENIYGTIYPRQTNTKIIDEENSFATELRREIIKGKLQRFLLHIRNAYCLMFLREIEQYQALALLKQNRIRSTKIEVFRAWKELVSKAQERQSLRQLILQKINKRKHIQSLDIPSEAYLSRS